MKSKKAIILILLIAAVAGAYFYYEYTKTMITVTFNNNCGDTSSEFFVYFPAGTDPQSIPYIEANESYVKKMVYKENPDSDSLMLYYYDYLGQKHDMTLVEYFEKGFKGDVEIDILEVDENGEYLLDITEYN